MKKHLYRTRAGYCPIIYTFGAHRSPLCCTCHVSFGVFLIVYRQNSKILVWRWRGERSTCRDQMKLWRYSQISDIQWIKTESSMMHIIWRFLLTVGLNFNPLFLIWRVYKWLQSMKERISCEDCVQMARRWQKMKSGIKSCRPQKFHHRHWTTNADKYDVCKPHFVLSQPQDFR